MVSQPELFYIDARVYDVGLAIRDYPEIGIAENYMARVIKNPETNSWNVQTTAGQINTSDLVVLHRSNKEFEAKLHRAAIVLGHIIKNNGIRLEQNRPPYPYSLALGLVGNREDRIPRGLMSQEMIGRARAYVNGEVASLNEIVMPSATRESAKERPSEAAVKTVATEANNRTGTITMEALGFEDIRKHANQVILELQKHIVGQDKAIRQMILRIISYLRGGVDLPILVSGPSGCGKTFLVKQAAAAFDLPIVRFAMPDATPAGYKGTNLQDIIGAGITALGKRNKGEGIGTLRYILHIDEFDKIVRPGDIFDHAIQSELLRLLEPNAVVNYSKDTRESAEAIPINGLRILSGAFSAIDYDHAVGLTAAEMLAIGFIPELVGRLDAHVHIAPLGTDELLGMIKKRTSGVGSAIGNLEKVYGIELELDNDTSEDLVKSAVSKKAGARAISSGVGAICDSVAEKTMFSSIDSIDGLRVDRVGGKLKVTVERAYLDQVPTIREKIKPRQRVGF
ncbi:AAA family ATPase [Candidatus Micrarchaeota archaeon]|nr:AAA family ATPase [Candidatus Micrarchaeota archaeon]